MKNNFFKLNVCQMLNSLICISNHSTVCQSFSCNLLYNGTVSFVFCFELNVEPVIIWMCLFTMNTFTSNIFQVLRLAWWPSWHICLPHKHPLFFSYDLPVQLSFIAPPKVFMYFSLCFQIYRMWIMFSQKMVWLLLKMVKK